MVTAAFRFNPAELNRDIARYSAIAERSLKESWLRAMRGIVKRAMGITPPASGTGAGGSARGDGGGLTKEDEERGRGAIARDLSLIFTAVRLKNKRREQLPDVAGKHRDLFQRFKQPGRPIRSDLGAGHYYHVDQRKLDALEKDLRGRVGKLASGWLAGATALGVTGTPAWVSRHGTSRGTHRLVLGFMRYQLTVANTSVPGQLVSELNRRLEYAQKYQANALERETEAILKKSGGEAGFDVR